MGAAQFTDEAPQAAPADVCETEMEGVRVYLDPQANYKNYIFREDSTMFAVFVMLEQVRYAREQAFQAIGYPAEQLYPLFEELMYPECPDSDPGLFDAANTKSVTFEGPLLPISQRMTEDDNYLDPAISKKDDDIFDFSNVQDSSAPIPLHSTLSTEENFGLKPALRNRTDQRPASQTVVEKGTEPNANTNTNTGTNADPEPPLKEYITDIDFAPDVVHLFQALVEENARLRQDNDTLRGLCPTNNIHANSNGTNGSSSKNEQTQAQISDNTKLMIYLEIFHGQGSKLLSAINLDSVENVELRTSISELRTISHTISTGAIYQSIDLMKRQPLPQFTQFYSDPQQQDELIIDLQDQ